MENALFFYQDEHLNAARTANGRLQMVVGADSLSLLASGQTGEVLALHAWQMQERRPENTWYESELPALLAQLEILHMPFAVKQCALASSLVTLTPNRLFNKDTLPKYFTLLRPDLERIRWGFEEIKPLGCHVIWGEEPHFEHLRPVFEPTHLAASLIMACRHRAPERGRSVFLNIRSKQAQIVVFDGQNLVFYNTFDFWKPNDLLYFALLAYDQFKLSPETHPLLVAGSITGDSEYYKALVKYIRSIEFIEPELPFNWPAQTGDLPRHYWFDLLNLS